MTWAERELWKELRRLDVNFRRQAPIGRYVVDFACHRASFVIELDGGVHERLEEVWQRDVERQLWLESQGYKAIRFTNGQVEKDLEGCVHHVKALLLDGGGLGGGVIAEAGEERMWAPAPNDAIAFDALRTPPSPTLPPSRRKGA